MCINTTWHMILTSDLSMSANNNDHASTIRLDSLSRNRLFVHLQHAIWRAARYAIRRTFNKNRPDPHTMLGRGEHEGVFTLAWMFLPHRSQTGCQYEAMGITLSGCAGSCMQLFVVSNFIRGQPGTVQWYISHHFRSLPSLRFYVYTAPKQLRALLHSHQAKMPRPRKGIR